MAPRGSILPPAQTESAREARKAFFCELCGKGYARMQDFENHESSYDHQHRKRMKDMKQMIRDPTAKASDQRRSEKSGMQRISLSSFSGNKGGVDYSGNTKKPVFASISQSSDSRAQSSQSVLGTILDPNDRSTATPQNDPSASDVTTTARHATVEAILYDYENYIVAAFSKAYGRPEKR